MALESSPDQTSRKVKHAMLLSGQRNSSGSSTSLSLSLSDNTVESSSSIDCNSTRLGLGNTRRNGVLDFSMPRVHSVGRAVEGLSTKPLQPDLINNHLDYQIKTNTSHCDSSERNTDTSNDIAQDDNIPYCTNQGKRLSDAGQPSKLNIPGNSVIVSCRGPVYSAEPFPIPTAENLRPYPPGLITIVKEGPAHESPSSILLASIEKELEDLEPQQYRKTSNTMAAEDKIEMNGVEQNGGEIKGCHCRIALQERLHATVKGCLQLQHQVDLADSKCARWEREAGEAAENAAVLRARVSELEIELAARNASLHGLKAKVAQQFMENDDINERRRQFERDCKAQLTQLDSVKKSEQWYREQLHLTQVERTTLQKQLMSAQEEGVRQAHEIERMRTDLKRVQDQLDEQEEKSLKEKQNFTMKLEKALAFSAQSSSTEDHNKSKEETDPHMVSELKQRVLDLELSLESNNNTLGRSAVEIDRLLARSLQLQRELSETKIKLQEEQDRYLSAAKDREKADAALQERDVALSQLSQEHAKLAVRLECQAREREEQDEALQSLTRNFNTVSSRFNAMRVETQQQRAEVEALRAEMRGVRAERDALQARVEEAARREQAAVLAARFQAGEREAARGVREARLEHEVLGLREATDRARGIQQRVDQLQAERDQLCGLNEQMRAQIERLSSLLQQNTGSRVREPQQPQQQQEEEEEEGARIEQLQAENNQLQVDKSQLQMEKSQLQGELEKSGMVKEQLLTENHQLQAQVQRSAVRLEELNHTIQALEAEMADIREQQQQQGEDDDEDDAEAEALEAEMTQLRTDNTQLQRDRAELTARVEELSQWLDTMTQGLGLGARGQAMERLARMTTSAVCVDGVDGQGDGQTDVAQQLRALRDANSELALYAAALQRRLDNMESGITTTTPRPRPDLLSASEGESPAHPQGAGRGQADEAEARGLLALLQVCLYRVTHGHLDGIGDVLQDGDDGALLVDDVGRLAAAIRRSVNRLAVSLEWQGLSDGDREGRLRALEALEEEHRDLREREGRRDALVRTLMARLKDQVLARKAAEQKLAALGLQGPGPGPHSCLGCVPNGATPPPAAGDGLAGGEGAGEGDVLEVVRLEQELAQCQANIAELHKQLFNERRDASQLRKEVASLRMGLDTANDMLDSNKVALGRSEAYGQVLKVSKDHLQDRFEKEQRDHEDCRARLERLQDQLQEARAKDPLIESQLKSLGCHLHQRTGEVRALQERLSLRDGECEDLRAQLERQRAAARREYDALRTELQQAQREFADALKKMSSNVPDPVPCDEEGLSALIQESNRLSPAVLDDLKALLHNLKAELKSVEKEVGFPCERGGPVVQHV